jgi:hypothetical protein
MVEILTTQVRTKVNSVSDLKNGKPKILETADLSNRLCQQKFCKRLHRKGIYESFLIRSGGAARKVAKCLLSRREPV